MDIRIDSIYISFYSDILYVLSRNNIMVFYPPEWVPKLPFDPPDSIPICDFMLDDRYGRVPIAKSRPFFICGLSGKKVTGAEVSERVDYLARALAKEFHWSPNEGTEWDKVCGVFSLNAVSTLSKRN